MKLKEIIDYLDKTLEIEKFRDASNNGLQISRRGGDVAKVAFGVDASVSFIKAAADAGCGLAVVHHGISWSGGIKAVTGAVYEIVKTAMDCNVALYAAHLPLDAHGEIGNNAVLVRELGLKNPVSAFFYNGRPIGFCATAEGFSAKDFLELAREKINPAARLFYPLDESSLSSGKKNLKVGICSGGAADMVAEAAALGCDVLLTGEGSHQDFILCESAGIPVIAAGHYKTETRGVRALCEFVRKSLGVETVFMDFELPY